MKEKVNIHAVAQRAGVSQPTVSKVINRYPHVKPATRQKVLDAIEELGFTPDGIARSMVKNRTFTIGLIVGDISNPFYAETAKVIIRTASSAGYEVFLLDTDNDNDNFGKCVKTLLAKRVDGIIAASVTRHNREIQELHESGFPVMLYNRNTEEKKTNYIELDNEKAGQLAMKHLVELGHRSIAYVSGPHRYSSFHGRYHGYLTGLKEFGLPYRPENIFDKTYEYDEILRFAQERMAAAERPTGFLVASDQMAFAVMDAAARSGLKVPEDISIMGIDNIDMAGNPFIGLTTVSQQKKKMADLAVESLIRLIEEGGAAAEPVRIRLEPELIVRKTTGPAPKRPRRGRNG